MTILFLSVIAIFKLSEACIRKCYCRQFTKDQRRKLSITSRSSFLFYWVGWEWIFFKPTQDFFFFFWFFYFRTNFEFLKFIHGCETEGYKTSEIVLKFRDKEFFSVFLFSSALVPSMNFVNSKVTCLNFGIIYSQI